MPKAVAHRRQTDIIFLGRGVSRGLADRRANVEKLQQYLLPVLATPADLAAALGITIPRLRWLAYHNEAATRHALRPLYGAQEKRRHAGTGRAAQEPAALPGVDPGEHPRQAARPRRGPRLHAWPQHGDQRRRPCRPRGAGQYGPQGFLSVDHLSARGGHVSRPGLLARRGRDPGPALHRIAAKDGRVWRRPLITWPPARRALPQGACTSPALSNRAARKLDMRLAGLAAKLGWNYTRYADDATFSASGEAAGKVGYLLARIRHISQDEGFAVNEEKTRVLRPNVAQRVTGIVVNHRPAVPRKLVRRLRAILHRAKTEGLAAQNRGRYEDFTSWLGGMIAYVMMVNPGPRPSAASAVCRPSPRRGKDLVPKTSNATMPYTSSFISRLSISVCCSLLCWSSVSWSVESPGDWDAMKPIVPRGYVCGFTDKPIVVDGRLDEPAWQARAWTEDFVDIQGRSKPQPRFRTHAKMLWDNDNLYISAELEEPHVMGTVKKHDAVIFADNDFEVFINPDGTNHDYYELELNALNTTWDLYMSRPYKDGGKADDSFEYAGMKTAVHVKGTINNPADKDEGWCVEIAIPWKALSKYAHRPCPPINGDQWRVAFPAWNGNSTSSMASTSRSPTSPKTIGSGRRRALSTCTAPSAGATCSSPRSRQARRPLCPIRPSAAAICSWRSTTGKLPTTRRTAVGRPV